MYEDVLAQIELEQRLADIMVSKLDYETLALRARNSLLDLFDQCPELVDFYKERFKNELESRG